MQRTMNAVERMRAKLSSWAAACRGFWRLENMAGRRARPTSEGDGRVLRTTAVL